MNPLAVVYITEILDIGTTLYLCRPHSTRVIFALLSYCFFSIDGVRFGSGGAWCYQTEFVFMVVKGELIVS